MNVDPSGEPRACWSEILSVGRTPRLSCHCSTAEHYQNRPAWKRGPMASSVRTIPVYVFRLWMWGVDASRLLAWQTAGRKLGGGTRCTRSQGLGRACCATLAPPSRREANTLAIGFEKLESWLKEATVLVPCRSLPRPERNDRPNMGTANVSSSSVDPDVSGSGLGTSVLWAAEQLHKRTCPCPQA